VVLLKFIVILCLAALAGCQSVDVRFARQAEALGLRAFTVNTGLFEHEIFINKQGLSGALHVYLAGDGTPWVNGITPANSPTPRNPIILSLMQQDASAAVLIGRPCYHGLQNNVACEQSLWTNRRYSSTVVDSMALAINQLVKQLNASAITLIGYSGGGTLAVLLAEKLPQTTTIVTLAANLNTDKWTEFHQLLPLLGSINPVNQPNLPASIVQRHYVGNLDKVIPVNQLKTYVDSHPSSEMIILYGVDHSCCWRQQWPNILQKM
jgi:hypothetical protein